MDKNYTVEEVAEILRLHPESVRRKIRKGEIKSIKTGRKHLITQSEVDRLLM